MPRNPVPRTSADHQRIIEAVTLRRVKKLLARRNNFEGEDERTNRIRDEYLREPDGPRPTLSAAEADALVANLPVVPRSGIKLRTDLPARHPTPT